MKIGMAVLIHERPDYLNLCLNSLFTTELYDYDVTFLLNDDGSKDPRVKLLMDEPRDKKYKIHRNFTSKGTNNAGQAINKAIDYLDMIGSFDIIGWCDSDAVFHPSWLDNTMKICLWARANHKEHFLGPFSSFNSSDFIYHKILGTYTSPYGNYVVKRQVGMLNYFMHRIEFKKFVENVNDETIMTAYLEANGIRNFCTETSYVEHIGRESTLRACRDKEINNVHALNLVKEGWKVEFNKND